MWTNFGESAPEWAVKKFPQRPCFSRSLFLWVVSGWGSKISLLGLSPLSSRHISALYLEKEEYVCCEILQLCFLR